MFKTKMSRRFARFCGQCRLEIPVVATVVFALLGGTSAPGRAQEYTPESPEVRAMIDLGVKYLDSRRQSGYTLGYEALVGYAVFKATDDIEHPVVQDGIQHSLKIASSSISGSQDEKFDEFVYAVSVAIQMLAAADPVKYNPELQKMLEYLKQRQRPDGAYGYKYKPLYDGTGDTSQTQYALLGLWALDHAQVTVPAEIPQKALSWLTKSQYQDGGFGYQYPSTTFPPNHVMTAVGMSAAMIAGDLLHALRAGGGSAMAALDGAEVSEVGVPSAFRRVVVDATGRANTKVSPAQISSITNKANNWINSHNYSRIPGSSWHYYWLYSIERYQAFLEAMKGKREKSPAWYNDIVKELQKAQSENGSWGRKDTDAGTAESCTAFAILVLLRATQKSMGELSEAVLTGGFGLKADMSSVDFSSGKVEDKKDITDMEAAMKMLEETKFDKDVSNDLAKRIRLDPDPQKRNEQLDRFARMLRSDNAVSRRVAAKILCRGDNLDMAPHLIYALSDPDGLTNINAENSLRVLSRQMNTSKIPLRLEEGQMEFPQKTRLDAQEYWKKWYLSIRPDYVFLENN